MANCVLFNMSAGWERSNSDLPAAMKALDKTKSGDEYMASNNNTAGKLVTLHASIMQAIRAFVNEREACALLAVGASRYVSEYRLDNGSVQITSYSENGDLQIAVKSATGSYRSAGGVGGRGDAPDHLPGIFLTLLPALEKNVQGIDEQMNALRELREEGITLSDCIEDKFVKALYKISDAMYRALENNEIQLIIPADGNISLLPRRELNLLGNGEVLCGAPNVLKTGKVRSSASKIKTVGELKQYVLSKLPPRSWTNKEQAMIPQFPDDYPVTREVYTMAHRFVSCLQSKRPMVNFMWLGPTSIGKSTGIEMLACVLQKPLLRQTCHTTMETNDFLSSFVPDTRPTLTKNELPTIDEMYMDPATAYEKLTGIIDEDATAEMCLQEYAAAAAKSDSTAPRFKHIESPYVTALVNGYLCEVQEASRIRNQGALVGLNEFDRPGAVIPLVDGTFRQRHAEAIVVFTDNTGYNTCQLYDPSVKRRMSFVLQSNQLSQEEVIKRAIYNTGCSDMTLLEKMYGIWEQIRTFCRDNQITEGEVSPTEFDMWVSCVQIEGEIALESSCIDCVVNKATSDPDEQAQIVTNVLNIKMGV